MVVRGAANKIQFWFHTFPCCRICFFMLLCAIFKGKIIAKEESSVGSVSWKVYCAFMKAGGGLFLSFLLFCFID